MSPVLRNIPNWLTMLRLCVIPLFAGLLMDPSHEMVVAAIFLFIFAALTDFVDGIIARRMGAVSDFGKLLDPLADKILVMAALVMLVGLRSDVTGQPWVPSWMVVVVLAREIWVTGLRSIASSRGIIVSANQAGKVKSGLQMVSIVFLLLHDTKFPFGGGQYTCEFIGLCLLLVSIVFSVWAAVEYTFMVFAEGRNGATGEARSVAKVLPSLHDEGESPDAH